MAARRAVRALQTQLGHDDPLSTMLWLLYVGTKTEVASMAATLKDDGWHKFLQLRVVPYELPDRAYEEAT
jgi:hypothetical protein